MVDRRRHVITGVTLLVLVGILGGAAYIGWRQLAAPVDSEAEDCDSGTVRAGERIRARDVTVSVFNAGTRSGLADQTQRQLRRRGFQRGEVGNAPDDVRIGVVQVWSTERNDAAARLVALQFGRKIKVRYVDESLGEGVDVVVGNQFTGLVDAPSSVRAQRTQSTCT